MRQQGESTSTVERMRTLQEDIQKLRYAFAKKKTLTTHKLYD